MFRDIFESFKGLFQASERSIPFSSKSQGNFGNMDAAIDIIKAVKTYIETPDTRYAIMIDGDWGCGKTFLWKNILQPEVGQSEAIYVSMFGLKDINDIENEIFKALSMVGTDEEGILQGLLNSNSNIAEDIRFGGLGFAVQFGLKKWKETRIKKSKSLFLCFDDLERWSGDIEICLSYINKLVEHDGAKCLIIGNAKQIKDLNKGKFNNTREKTIGFKYKLDYPPEIVLNIATKLVNFPSSGCKKYVDNLLYENRNRIFDLLKSAKCSNIRILSTAIHYLIIVYLNNKEKFEISPTSSISYFISLLATYILVESHKNSEKDRGKILVSSVDNVIGLTKELGIISYQDNGDIKKLTEEEKIVDHLITNAFYHSDEIKHKGKSSIINNGFYKAEDFEEEFYNWKKTDDYEYYLDTFKFWYLNDEEAKRIFSNTYKAIFEEKCIHNPSVLLLLTDRITHDIKRGVLNLDFEKTKSEIRHLFDYLYEQNKMECLRNIDPGWGIRRFEYCEDIYSYVIEKNGVYFEKNEKTDLSKFWIKLKENPKCLNELMDSYKTFEIFSLYENPDEIVEVIECLGNDQLFELTRWMGSRVSEDRNCLKAVEKEHDRGKEIAKILEKKYGEKFGVKAGHMKQISRILKNKRTDYDPEYMDEKIKKKTTELKSTKN
jgi:KAP family P-loop domain